MALRINGTKSSQTDRIIHKPRNPSGPAKRSYPAGRKDGIWYGARIWCILYMSRYLRDGIYIICE